jgi:hypothetical protein
MFERMSSGFSLARSSLDVLRKDKKLLLFPVFSGIGCVLVMITFFLPTLILLQNGGLVDQNDNVNWVVALPLAFAYYMANYFVVIFCNAALIHCALMHFNGYDEEATVGAGFRTAASRLPQILAWAAVSATVGLLLKAIENAHEKVGQWISAILGTAWTIMTVFVVPILVVEKVGPFAAIGRSIELLKKAWGEGLSGRLGLGLVILLLFVPVILLAIFTGLAFTASTTLGIILLVVTIIGFLLVAIISSALQTIFLTALYQYAAFERVPQGFEADTLKSAFSSKAA